jgi:membrane protein required for colicin V production
MYIDIFLAIFIRIGIIQGFHRGLIRTLFSILGIVIGFLAALKFAPYVVTFFENVFKLSPLISLILGLLLTFVVLMLGIRWLGKSFENTLKLVRLNFINKIAGAVVFAALMIIVYSAVIWFIDRTNVLTAAEKEQSKSYPVLTEIPVRTGAAIQTIKPVFREFWDKMDRIVVPADAEEQKNEQEQ